MNEDFTNIPVRAGIIPYFEDAGQIFVCCIKTNRTKYLEFCKGHIDFVENELQAAIREGYEELGYINKKEHKVKLLSDFNSIRFFCVKINVDEINTWKKPVFKGEVKEVVCIKIDDMDKVIIDWQKPLVKMLKRKIKF